jgi:phage shock protein C
MFCARCQHELPDGAQYCVACGSAQEGSHALPWSARRLRRLRTEGKLAGVCAGLAAYIGIDVAFVRVAWVVLSVVPGAVVGGVLAYLLAWLVMPEGQPDPAQAPPQRIVRSSTDIKIAGVCGGLSEYFGVDSTALRLLWVVLTLLPGAIVGGVVLYLVAWLIMPKSPAPALAPTGSPAGPGA